MLSDFATLLSSTALWCAVMHIANADFAATQTAYVVPPSFVDRSPLRSVVSAGDETFVTTFEVGSKRDHAVYRVITKVGAAVTDEPVRVPVPLNKRTTWTVDYLSEGFVVSGKDWWYVTLDDHDGVAATTFVKSDGSRVTHVKPPAQSYTPDTNDVTHSNSWQTIAIPGEKPRALELTFRAEDSIVREVDWGGASRSWRLPPVGYKQRSRAVALPLPDGRIALLWNRDGLSLYLLGEDGHVEANTLRNVRIQQFDAAIDRAGRIAIVAARNAIPTSREDTGTVDAAIIDPAHADRAEWSVLRHDVRVTGILREVQVVANPEGFAAAWINEVHGRHIEATDVDSRGHAGPVVDVGQASPRGDTAFFSMQAKDDALLFWWDDGEHLFQRRLPLSLERFAALGEFTQSVCGTL